LAESLRREARASRPEFSEARHAAICRAVRECRAQPATVRSSWRRTRLRWFLAVGAAACLLAGGWIVWQNRTIAPGTLAVCPTANVPPPATAVFQSADQWTAAADWVDQAAAKLDELVDTTTAPQPWANLDQDLRGTVDTLAENLPLHLFSALATSDGPKQWKRD
jgi:hypothetical protein